MGVVTRLDAQEWVDRLKATRRARHQGKPAEPGDEDVPTISPATIHNVVHIMSQLYTTAMREHHPIVLVNPFDHLELPRIEPRPVEFLEHEEAEALYPAVEAAAIRRFPPRIMRHTAAPWLVEDGVPLMDVQMLLGHEDYSTTQRYAHRKPDAHDKVIQSWARRNDASVTHPTHGRRETGPS